MISRRSMKSWAYVGGFSLLEVIAAILLLAIAFAALMKVAGGSMNLSSRAAEISRADMWAQSKLDGLGVAEPVRAGDDKGDFDLDYRWRMRVTRWTEPSVPADSTLTLYRVELDVQWGDMRSPRSARYVTLRAVDEKPLPAPVRGAP